MKRVNKTSRGSVVARWRRRSRTMKADVRVRKKAEETLVRAVTEVRIDNADLPKTVCGFIPYISKAVGVSIEIRECEMADQLAGFVEQQLDDSFVISLSPQCATVEHTLAHEVAHIVLGHETCCCDDLDLPGSDYADLSRFLAGVDLNETVEWVEREAEIFADHLVRLVELVQQGGGIRAIIWGSSLSA